MTNKPKKDAGQGLEAAFAKIAASGGVVAHTGAYLARRMRAAKPLSEDDHSPIANAVRKQWPGSDAYYHAMVVRRFTELFEGLPEKDALHAIRANLSSPITAMDRRIIRRRRYLGFPEDRE
jgi:hypothetical protein